MAPRPRKKRRTGGRKTKKPRKISDRSGSKRGGRGKGRRSNRGGRRRRGGKRQHVIVYEGETSDESDEIISTRKTNSGRNKSKSNDKSKKKRGRN